MVDVDLDALRAARREVAGEPVTVGFAGSTFTLPAEIPLEVLLAFPSDLETTMTFDHYLAVARAFLDEQFDAFRALKPTTGDVRDFVDAVLAKYAVGLGESRGSDVSSARTSEPSRPTSSGSTGSAKKSSSARKRGG